jgi:hypothetical protein
MTASGRVGVPDDIGPTIAALLSDDNRWVNCSASRSQAGCRCEGLRQRLRSSFPQFRRGTARPVVWLWRRDLAMLRR